VQLARAFGWHGERCDRSADLARCLERAFAHEGPSLLVIPIDYDENRQFTARLGKIGAPI